MDSEPQTSVAPYPARIGRYQIAGRLAVGGMAELFLGKLLGPSGFERPVVVKRILPHLARDTTFRSMFLDEARIAAGINSANVVQVSELGQEGDDLFIVMEYLSGETAVGLLRCLSQAQELLSPALAAHIVAEACAGLQAAHELTDAAGDKVGLVHRDISPDNLFITYDGAVKVLDFGIAQAAGRLTRTQAGELKGKFSYMSPEQCRVEPLDARSDIYALGIVLWELSVGKRLFRRRNELLTMRAICEDPTPRPEDARLDYPKELVPIVLRALEKAPGSRYDSARQMRLDLLAAIRKLAPDHDLVDELRKLMVQTFPERIQEKSAMLRAVREGATHVVVPVSEIGDDDNLRDGVSQSSQSNTRSETELVRPRSSRLPLSAAVAILVAAAGIGIAASMKKPPAPTPVIVPQAPPPIAKPEPPAEVSITLESTPPKAQVLVNGEARGETPITLKLRRDDKAVALELRHDGYKPDLESVVPNVDQRLKLPLVSIPKAAPKKPPTERSFRRFE